MIYHTKNFPPYLGHTFFLAQAFLGRAFFEEANPWNS